MFCYDEKGKNLGVISCYALVGETHIFNDVLYRCIETSADCKGFVGIFQEVK